MNQVSKASRLFGACFFVFSMGLGTSGALATSGCTKQQGQSVKTGVKDTLDFGDAICLSGVLDRVDLDDEGKLAACGIVGVLKDLAHRFLVQEAGIRQAAVARQLTAHAAAPCASTATMPGKDAGAK